MRLRGKPVKPVRKQRQRYLYTTYGGDSLASIVDYFRALDIPLEQVEVDYHVGYYEDIDIEFCAYGRESEVSYNARLSDYRKRLAKYNEWYEANREEIEAEIEKRKVLAEEKAQKALQAAKKRAEREKKKLEKELKKLEKKMKGA